jgi:hypothetical protein
LHPSHKPKPPTLHRHRAPSPGLRRLLPRLIRPSLAVGSVAGQGPAENPSGWVRFVTESRAPEFTPK